MSRPSALALSLALLWPVHGMPQTSPAVTPPAAPELAPKTPEGAEPATPQKAGEDDPFLTNYRKYEHRDERAPGRGPMGRKIGFGLALGRPISGGIKIFFTQTLAFQGDFGTTYSWFGPEFSVSGHLVWHPYTLLANDTFKLSTYVGGGPRFAVWPGLITGIPSGVPYCTGVCKRPAFSYVPGADAFPGTLGIQGLVGIDLQLQKVPLEFYAQPLATLEGFPSISADLGLQVGGRWYFF